MENKVLELIKLHTSNLQRNKQTELSLENEQLKLAQEIVKLFAIPDVSQQRELLRAFLDHIDCYSDTQINASYDHLIDGFFEARNCG